jgi:hypothetical protein
MSEKSHARRLGFKLFLEGIEIDMISCKVTGGMGKPTTAAISIPANDEAHRIEPRTLVHVFFYENKYELGTVSTTTQMDKTGATRDELGNYRPLNLEKRLAEKGKGVAAQLTDYNDIMNWKLLFTGEVMGYGFSKIGALRSINLMCSDFSTYWNMAQMYWGGKVNSDTKKRAIFLGATRLYHGPKTKVASTDRLTKVLKSRPNGFNQPQGILGGLVSLLESATGVFSPGENGKAHRGVNDMMSYAELRYHLTRTVGASDKDETASIFMSSSMFNKWLRQVGKSVRYTATYMQVVQSLLPHLHYEWNSVPVPPYVPASDSSLASTAWKTIPTTYSGSGNISLLRRKAKYTHKLVQTHYEDTVRNKKYLDKTAMSLDPMLYQDASLTKNAKTSILAEQGMFEPGTLADWKNPEQLEIMGLDLRKEMEKKAKGSKAVKLQAVRIQEAFKCAAKVVRLNLQLEANENDRILGNWDAINRELDCVRKKSQGNLKKPQKRVDLEGEAANSRLHMHLFRPDLYMCPPPKCNVLFPDMIQSIQYTRNWMSEITRLWLFTRNTSGRSRKDMYFAPTTSLILGADNPDKPSAAEEAVRQRVSFHMNHEKFSGIVPVFEAVSDWAEMKKAYKKNIGKDNELKNMPNAHLVRAANFMFFKRRFGTRTMSVTLRFSPQLVAGLPCMILDPLEKTDKGERTDRFDINSTGHGFDSYAKDKASFEGNGTHYFGVIHHIEHVSDASGGAQTRIMLSHCRTHKEGPDLFSGGEDLSTWTYKTYTSKRKKGANKKAELMGGGDGNVDVYNQDWEDLLGTDYNPKATYTADVVRTDDGRNKYTTFADGHRSKMTGLDDPAEHPRADIGEIDGGYPNYIGTNKYQVPAVELKVYEITKGRRAKKINFTFEGMVTPPWYSNIFYPDQIGREYYYDMLGCRSVVDDPAIHLSPEVEKKHKSILEGDANAVASVPGANLVEENGGLTMVEIYTDHQQYNDKLGQYEPSSVFVPIALVQQAKSARYAAEYLSEAWLGFKRMGTDINMFIDTYVDRSYATMLDVFGNENLSAYDTMSLGSKKRYKTEGTVKGFHGFAFGEYEGLASLKGATERLAVSTDDKMKMRPVKAQIDTRKQKHLRVREYKNALLRHARNYTGK